MYIFLKWELMATREDHDFSPLGAHIQIEQAYHLVKVQLLVASVLSHVSHTCMFIHFSNAQD